MTADSIVPKIALGVALLGAAGGVVGAFAVLRRRALLGDTLAHASLPGICLAHLLLATRELWILSLGALVAGLLGVLCVTVIPKWTRTRDDAALGLVLSTFFGAGVILLTVTQKQATGNQAGLNSYLFGEVAGLRTSDIYLLATVAIAVIATVILFFKELKLLSFDEGFASSQGWPTFGLDIAVMSAVAVVTITCLPICGVILMAAVLIFPYTTARYWSDRLGVVLTLSGLVGAGAAVLGVLAVVLESRLFSGDTTGLPPGPMIVLASGLLFVLSLLLAPRRGLLAQTFLRLKTRVEVATDHFLRVVYEIYENQAAAKASDSIDQSVLRRRLSCDDLTYALVLRKARSKDWITGPAAGRLFLTEEGLDMAARVTRTHRLWETFLMTNADIAADHVHRPADELEHFLPHELVESLEARLAHEGRLPEAEDLELDQPRPMPPSPHSVE